MKMKKNNLLILAVAALGFAACANDETTAVNEKLAESNAISFRANVAGNMRAANAAGVKASFESGDQISVYAEYNGGKYFQDNFTKQAGDDGFTSVNKHYWPSDVTTNNVTFTAIWGSLLTTPALTIGSTAGNFTGYIPNAAAASQEDILVAEHTSATKEAPVPLNFRHALSQIVVKAKNTNPSLKVTITGVRIGYIKTASSSFTYSGGVTDTRETGAGDGGNIAQGDWTLVDFKPTPTTTTANDYKYDQDVSTLELIGKTSDTDHELTGTTSWLLLPQNMTDAAGKYATQKTGTKATPNPDLAGAYLALKMTIENYNGTAATGTIVSEQWCYWPITQAWNPGFKYTYTIDVAGGGYEPEDTDNDKNLDPVLDGAVIVFSPSCTIDAWDPANYTVGNMVYAKGGTYTANIPSTAGTYTITITGLTSGVTPTVTGTVNCTSPTCTAVGTTGTTLVTCNVSAGSGTSVITVDNDGTGAGTETTVINLVQP